MSQLTICFIIFILTIIGYCSGLYSLASIALTSMMCLTLTGCLGAKEALGYFANSNVIMVGGMCVVAAGLTGQNSVQTWQPASRRCPAGASRR